MKAEVLSGASGIYTVKFIDGKNAYSDEFCHTGWLQYSWTDYPKGA